MARHRDQVDTAPGMNCKSGKKLSYDAVFAYFAAHGRPLLSGPEALQGFKSMLRFRCPCGAEVETRWDNFRNKRGTTCCGKCAVRNNHATMRARNGGTHLFKTEEFKEGRKAKNREKYGVDWHSQLPEVKRKQKATLRAKYGVDHILHLPEVNARQRASVSRALSRPETQAKHRATIQLRYGVPSMAFLSRRTSNESAAFFTMLFEALPESDKTERCYFAPRTREFNAWYQKRYYKYDFVHTTLKKAIEYNGSKFHPKPEQHDDEIGWCLYHPERTVRDARAYETAKLDALHARGFEVLVVWDHEVKHDAASVVARCVEFLTTPGSSRWSPGACPSRSCP